MKTITLNKIIICIALLNRTLCLFGQATFSNVVITPSEGRVTVAYDLQPTMERVMLKEVRLVVLSKGKTIVPETISGAIGKKVSFGRARRIVWDCAADGRFFDGNVEVILDADCDVPQSFGTVLEPETVLVEGGTFQMGSENGDLDEKPIHSVTVNRFQMGKYEVTNAEFCAFLNAKGNQIEGGTPWIQLSGSYDAERCRIKTSGNMFEVERGFEQYPVIYVSHYGAAAYCEWLAARTGKAYRLPTEAEWEYAAGNGARHTKYSWGSEFPNRTHGGNVADETTKKRYATWLIFDNYTDNHIYTAPVGQFSMNDFGLYDMTGNVWEWCSDWKSSYSRAATTYSTGAVEEKYRVLRGGSWFNAPRDCRVTERDSRTPNFRSNFVGFRVAFVP